MNKFTSLLLVLLCLAGTTTLAQKKSKVVKTQGSQIIEPNGNATTLKGTNLGNWLVPEGYMFKTGNVAAPRQIDQLLHEMIGPDSLKSFWLRYLDNYITQDDIKYLKRIGCNHMPAFPLQDVYR